LQILAVDVGTGTQDILLYDTEKEPENAFQMIMPSPTQIVAAAIRQATAAGEDVALVGSTMGGGPCNWAAQQHLKAGRKVYATPAAACTIDDDLVAVMRMGVRLISEDEAERLRGVRRLVLRDLDMDALRDAFGLFGVRLEPAAIGVAVFDHGAAPPGYSDRRFRFEYLADRLQGEPTLAALAFRRSEIPPQMTRMQAAADEAGDIEHVLVMDTPSAAMLGAREDRRVAEVESALLVNVGNSHTLAFRLQEGRVAGLFEHHTGRLTTERLDDLLEKLAAGRIKNDEVYDDHGHGALLFDRGAMEPALVSVTGPRRMLMAGSRWRPYFAVPYGDMMVAGCWGLVRALAQKSPGLGAVLPR
jgi:uncharacterized protein (DUF1786 family)